jgi:biopolymer transport protein TolQ
MMFQSGLAGLISSLGLVSKVILLLLFLFSVISWAVILYKWRVFRTVDREDQRFLTAFAKSKDSDELRRHARRVIGSPSASVFMGLMDRLDAGHGEEAGGQLSHLRSQEGGDDPGSLDRQYIERTVAYIVQNQIAQLEAYLPFLATTGNITPFIGLLGTVLGIIDSFREIGLQGTASIAAVAPGVAEALIATAAGLFTAIPAVIAYNYYLTRIRRTAFRLETFSVDLLNSVQTQRRQAGLGVR